MPAYWTEAVSRRALAGWMPFQSMGYPFRLHLQSGLWYPPLWLFPLLRVPYTLHAAVVLQAIHVLFGAVGMYALLRTVLRSRGEAVAGAFVFQLFGGFYSNAEHVDIVRAFALTPWLLTCLAPPREGEDRFPARLLALPLAVWALAVGGYPGNLISALFLAAALLGWVLAASRMARNARRWAAAAATAVCLGLLMAASHLGPAWIYRHELERHRAAAGVQRASLSIDHIAGLLEDIRGMPGDPSMSSTFVGFVVICGLCFLDRRALRGLSPFVVLLVLSGTMAAGDNTPAAPLLRSLAAPLAYSRFPSSDYRGVFAVLLILLAAAGWTALRVRPPTLRTFCIRLAPAAAFSGWAIWSSQRRLPLAGAGEAALGTFVLAVASLALWRGARRAMRPWALGLMLAAASLDAARVLSRLETWSVPDLIGTCRLYQPPLARLADAGLVVSPGVFTPRRGPRPARTDGEYGYRASGYLTGGYNLGDFGGPVLSARERAAEDPAAFAFATREWLPLVLERVEHTASSRDVRVSDLAGLAARASGDERVEQLSYGLDRIDYRVRLGEPALVVENEIFFPGWSGVIREAGRHGRTVEAIRVDGVWRGWELPAGRYDLEARFELHGARVLLAVTAGAWIAWATWALIAFRRSLPDLIPVRV